jgi:hypothetical protein
MRADTDPTRPKTSRRTRSILIAALAAVIVLVAGTAYGVSQTQSPTLHACSAKSTGALRLVAPGSKCKSKEIPVFWNVQGPRGNNGTSGVSGYQLVHNDLILEDGNSGAQGNASVDCPTGTTALGGGGAILSGDEGPNVSSPEDITYTAPLDDARGWQVGWKVDYGSSGTTTYGLRVRVYATCAVVANAQ